MRASVTQQGELWAATIDEEKLPPDNEVTDKAGDGIPVIVTREHHPWGLPSEWRNQRRVGADRIGIFTVEPWALQPVADLALEALSAALRLASAIDLELRRIGISLPRMQVVGHVFRDLEEGSPAFVARSFLAHLREIPTNSIAGEWSDVPPNLRVVHKAPVWVAPSAEATPMLVRRDGVVVEISTRYARGYGVLGTLPAGPLLAAPEPPETLLPAIARCRDCGLPHPDRKQCPTP